MSEIPIMVMPWHRPDPCKPSKMQTAAAFKASYLDYLGALSLDSPPLSVILSNIMCTIGFASNNVDILVDLMQQGMTLALVPLERGLRQDHIDTIANLRSANTAYSQIKKRVFPLGIAVQTKGPGLRVGGLMKDKPIDLPLHHKIVLTTDKAWRTKSTEHLLYIGFPEMCEVLGEGDVLLLGNGIVILQIESIDGNEAACKVVGPGVVTSCMPVSVSDVPLNLPPLTDEDVDDLRLAATLGVDVVVATRTQTGNHIREIRKILAEEENGSGIKVWAQLESKKGLENLESILDEADGVLLSRLSLTQDMPADKLFLAQKIVLATCNKVGIPVFVSSHYLPSMQIDVTPSVSELIDVSTAILDGADGFVLRNTTSIGKHPQHTVKTLTDVCLEAEAAVWHFQTFAYLNNNSPPPIDPTQAIAISAVEASLKASAAAIFLATTSGRSAQLVARYRPRCPIIAITRYGQVARQLNCWRAVIPLHYVDPPLPDWTREIDVRLQFGIEFAKQQGIVNPGDSLVLLNGWRQGAGFTNTIRIVYASESFPWVYPHPLPLVVPSDKSVSELEKKLSPKATVENMGKTKSAQSALRGSSSMSKSGFTTIKLQRGPPPSAAQSRVKSMEDHFTSVAKAGSNKIQEITLAGEFAKSKSDIMSAKNISDPMSQPKPEIENDLEEKGETDSQKPSLNESQEIDNNNIGKHEVQSVSNVSLNE